MEQQHVLVMGLHGEQLDLLGTAISKCARNEGCLSLSVFIANTISNSKLEEIGEIHYFIFAVDMTSRLSFEKMQEEIVKLDRRTALSKSAIVLFQADNPLVYSFSIDEVERFASHYGLHIEFSSVEDRKLEQTGAKLSRRVINNTRAHGVSPLFPTCLELDIVKSTVLT